jgi:hypothetical protein
MVGEVAGHRRATDATEKVFPPSFATHTVSHPFPIRFPTPSEKSRKPQSPVGDLRLPSVGGLGSVRPFCVAVRSVVPLPERFLQERTLQSARGAARAGFVQTNSCFRAQRKAESAAFFVRTEANKVGTVLVEGV